MTIKYFIAKYHVTADAVMVDANPNMDDDKAYRMHHYKVTLKGSFNGHRAQMTVPFSMGEALTDEPGAADVLDCLASDASGVENAQGFEDWASGYGYDADSRKAERTYKACEKLTEKLKRFCGDDAYRELLEAERL